LLAKHENNVQLISLSKKCEAKNRNINIFERIALFLELLAEVPGVARRYEKFPNYF